MTNGVAEWFGLKRANYILNPSEDANFYAPRSDVSVPLMVEDLRVSLATHVSPKRIFWGLYGGGKTHTLFKISKELEKLTSNGIHTVYIECPTVDKKSTFLHFYQEGIIQGMGQELIVNLFEEFFNATFIEVAKLPNITDRHTELIRKLREKIGDEEFSRAITMLSMPDTNKRLLFWKYISAIKIPRELSDLGLSRDLSDAEPAKLAEIIIIIGKVLRQVKKKTLALILDELDRLQVITDEAAVSSFQTAFRKLLGIEQNDVVVLMGCSAVDLRYLPEVFGAAGERAGLGPVLSKIGKEGLVPIHGIDVADFDSFVREIIKYIRDPQTDIDTKISKLRPEVKERISNDTFPFTEEAIEALKGVIGASMTPMEITRRMTQAIGRAYLLKKSIVTLEMIR